MLIDKIEIKLRAGKGGAGKASFFPGRRGKPSGGNGGDGGSVLILAVNDITALNQYSGIHELFAEDGQPGGPNRKIGKKGKSLELKIPVGTLLTDTDTHESWDLSEENQKLLLCKGGKNGKGNSELKRDYYQPGLPGEEKNMVLNLKLIADYGLIGLPNAGKTSLLNHVTAAHAKTAGYAFTTLEPNLGVMNGKVIADIPGLIEGASEGKGLGHRFLKHIEKVNLLIHCISAESEDLPKDYQVIRRELGNYNAKLLEKTEIVLLTKTDLLTDSEVRKKVKILKKLNPHVQHVSIYRSEDLRFEVGSGQEILDN